MGETTTPRRKGFGHEDGGLVNECAGGDVRGGELERLIERARLDG